MTLIREVISYLEEIAPKSLQESYDNAGVQVGRVDIEVTGVLFCLDSTEEVVREAVDKSCNLIIAHHPIIFRGIKSLTGEHYVHKAIIEAIHNEVTIYAIHTNLDNILYQGVNGKIAEKLQLKNNRVLLPKKTEMEGTGSGLIGELEKEMRPEEFLHYLTGKMEINCIRHTDLLDKPVKKVALCGGSGSFLLPWAIREGAEVFISSDFKYHDFFESNGQIIIADIGHYESEQYTIELLSDLFSNKFRNFAGYCTELITNPIKYYYK